MNSPESPQPGGASGLRRANSPTRCVQAACLLCAGWLTFYAASEAGCQTNNGTLLGIQPLPGNGYWIAGVSSLESASPLKNIRLAGVAGDSVLGFRGGYGVDAPTSLWLQTNSSFGPIPMYSFPQPLSEEAFLCTSFGYFAMMLSPTNHGLPRQIWKGDLTLTNWHPVVDAWPLSSNVPPSAIVLRQGWDADKHGNVFAGEYNSDDAAFPDYRIRIFKGTNYGENWSVAYTFPPRNVPGSDGGIRHIHACQVDPYTGDVWIATGDLDSQCRIYYHTNALLPNPDGNVRLTLVGGGSQEFRVVSLAFTQKYIYWFMDTPSVAQKIFRIRRATGYPVLSPQTASAQDYRECLGVFPDKPFYYNRVVKSAAGDDVILVVSHYENASRWGSFREVDKWNRVFGIKEFPDGTAQVQEVFAVLATAIYAQFDPLGQNSAGEIFFRSGNVAGENADTGYKAILNWRDVPSSASSNHVALELSWVSQTNKYYQVKQSQDLETNGWSNVGLGFHGDGLTNSLYYSGPKESSRLFKMDKQPFP